MGALLVLRPRVRFAGSPRTVGAVALVAALALVPAGYLAQRSYMRDRYADWGPMPSIARWARDVDPDSRIAIANFFIQYPLAGLNGTIGVTPWPGTAATGTFTPSRTWPPGSVPSTTAIRYVVTTPAETRATSASRRRPRRSGTCFRPSVTPSFLLRDNKAIRLFRIDGPTDWCVPRCSPPPGGPGSGTFESMGAQSLDAADGRARTPSSWPWPG